MIIRFLRHFYVTLCHHALFCPPDWDFFPFSSCETEDAVCAIHPLRSLSLSLRIKMSLAVQLWLTPSAPHPAEQLPLFDESGPVCFPCSSRCVMHDSTPLPTPKHPPPQNAALFHTGETGGSAGSGFFFSFFFSESTLKKKACGKERKAHRWMLLFFFFFAEAEKWFAVVIRCRCDACRKVNKKGLCTVPQSSG